MPFMFFVTVCLGHFIQSLCRWNITQYEDAYVKQF